MNKKHTQITALVSLQDLQLLAQTETPSTIVVYKFLLGIKFRNKPTTYGYYHVRLNQFPVSASTVITSVARLETLGYLKINRSHGKDKHSGYQHSYGYKLLKNEGKLTEILVPAYNCDFSKIKYHSKDIPTIPDASYIALEDSKNKSSVYRSACLNLKAIDEDKLSITPDQNNRLLHYACSDKTPKHVDYRIYSQFHFLKKDLRKYISINDSPVIELFDVKCCVLLMCCSLFRQHLIKETLNVSDIELDKLVSILKNGDIYVDIAKTINPVIYEIDTVDNIESRKQLRSEIKLTLQHVINILPRYKHAGGFYNNVTNVKDIYYNRVRAYMLSQFPTIMEAIETYPVIKRGKKTSKSLFWDFTKIEFEIISNICTTLIDRGIIALSVHDAIFITTADLTKVTYHDAEQMFWNEYQKIDIKLSK